MVVKGYDTEINPNLVLTNLPSTRASVSYPRRRGYELLIRAILASLTSVSLGSPRCRNAHPSTGGAYPIVKLCLLFFPGMSRSIMTASDRCLACPGEVKQSTSPRILLAYHSRREKQTSALGTTPAGIC